MTIKTIDEYRTRIRKQEKPALQQTDEKYFVAGYVGASMAAHRSKRKDRRQEPEKLSE